MLNIWNALDIGKQGLYAQSSAISVTGNNIANVNTEGYSRQRVILQASANGFGVKATGAERYYDSFLFQEMNNQNQLMNKYTEEEKGISRLEALMDESVEDVGLGQTLDDYFSSWATLANDPASYANRGDLVTRTQSMIQTFQRIQTSSTNLRYESNANVEEVVKMINEDCERIAELNSEIVKAEAGGSMANYLRDERDTVIHDLSGYIEVNSFEDDMGRVSVLIANGIPMVEGSLFQSLDVTGRGDNSGYLDIVYQSGKTTTVNITDRINGGKLGGLLNLRDEIIPDYMEQLNRLAASIVNETNKQHQLGVDLNGVTGQNYYEPLSVYSAQKDESSGGAQVTASSVSDQTLLTLDKYEIRFTAANSFDIINTTTDSVVSAGNAYSSGNAISFDGISITISDDTGTPQDGDVFFVDTVSNAIQYMDVNSALENDYSDIAAGATSSDGDNTNAMAISDLQYAKVVQGGTFREYYSSTVSSLGIEASDLDRYLQNSESSYAQLEARRESVSGVSLDEEANNLIRYQSSYQASARYVSICSDLLDNLMGIL